MFHIFSGWKLADHLELVLVYSDVLIVGTWLLFLLRRWCPKIGFWYDMGTAYTLGTVFFAMTGLCIIAFPELRLFLCWICGVIGPMEILIRFRSTIYSVISSVSRVNRLGFLIWIIFLHTTLCYSTLLIKYPDPATIPDGFFVFKQDRIYTRVQYIAGLLPCDNYIPFAVGECLMKGVPMRKDYFILPGQKIGDRPFFMAYLYIAFRDLVKPEPSTGNNVPTFSYVGSEWPNTFVFGSDGNYRLFLPVAIFFNGLMIICLYVLLEAFGFSLLIPVAGFTLVTSPYIISQTMFAWPKDAAGFFLLFAYVSAFIYSRPLAAGFLLAAGYYCHPYALTYGVGAFTVMGLRQVLSSERYVLKVWLTRLGFPLAVYVATLSPWILWQLFSLGSNSDLIAQNFSAHHSLKEQVMTRIGNLLVTLYYYRAQPFVGHGYVDLYSWSFVFILGIAFVPFVLWGSISKWSRYSVIMSAAFISMALIIGVFSEPAFAIVHGTQVFIVLCFSISIVTTFEVLGQRGVYLLSLFQILLNVAIWLSKIYFLEI